MDKIRAAAHLTLALAPELGAAADRPGRAVDFRRTASRAVGAVAAGDRHGRRRRAKKANRARVKALGTNLEWWVGRCSRVQQNVASV